MMYQQQKSLHYRKYIKYRAFDVHNLEKDFYIFTTVYFIETKRTLHLN